VKRNNQYGDEPVVPAGVAPATNSAPAPSSGAAAPVSQPEAAQAPEQPKPVDGGQNAYAGGAGSAPEQKPASPAASAPAEANKTK
jgi:hypothetical protein